MTLLETFQVRHFYKKLYFNPGHFVTPKEKWKHTNSLDFDTLLLEKSLEQVEERLFFFFYT